MRRLGRPCNELIASGMAVSISSWSMVRLLEVRSRGQPLDRAMSSSLLTRAVLPIPGAPLMRSLRPGWRPCRSTRWGTFRSRDGKGLSARSPWGRVCRTMAG